MSIASKKRRRRARRHLASLFIVPDAPSWESADSILRDLAEVERTLLARALPEDATPEQRFGSIVARGGMILAHPDTARIIREATGFRVLSDAAMKPGEVVAVERMPEPPLHFPLPKELR